MASAPQGPPSAPGDPGAVRPGARKGWLRRLAPWLGRHRGSVVVAFGAAILGMAVQVLIPLVERRIVDRVIVAHDDGLALLLTLMLAGAAVAFAAAHVRRYVGGRLSLDVQYDLRTAMYERLQRLDAGRHDELSTGQLVTRANSDITLIQGLLGFAPILTGNLVMLVLSLAVMFVLSPPLAAVVLLVVPAIAYLSARLRRTVFPATWDAQQRYQDVTQVVDDDVTGVRVVKAFGQERREMDRLEAAAVELYRGRVRTVRLQAGPQAALAAVPTLAQVAVLALGGWLAIEGHLSLGTFLVFSTYVVQLSAPARQLSAIVAIAQQARAGTERVLDLIETNPLVTEVPDAPELRAERGEVSVEGVWFGYSRDSPVLRGFDLHVAAGETVALVGPSGSGKSTVSLLLPRFYDPWTGRVLIDGQDVSGVSLSSLRDRVGVVFEEPFLFSDTVRANLGYGKPDATDEELREAASAAEALEFIDALPEGMDTVVGERGLTLSGGQRQRLALARALLTRPSVLVLDDATSAVDATTEEGIHATLARLLVGRTTILIAHRRSTLRLADRIVVVADGRVLDQGTHEELIERCGAYAELVETPGDALDAPAAPPAEAPAARVGATPGAEGVHDRGLGSPGRGGLTPAIGAGGPDGARPGVRAGAGIGGWGGPGGGGGGGGWMGGGGGGWMSGLAATPELLASIERLPPADDEPEVDLAAQRRYEPTFLLRRFVKPFRLALVVSLGLVVADTLLSLAGPLLIKSGIDGGVSRHDTAVVMLASAVFLAAALVDWVDTWVQARYTGRLAQRMLLALRARIWAHLQRLGLDYYEQEMAGRVMTRMTTDVEALSQLLQNGLVNALVAILSFVGVAIALLVLDWELALVALSVLPVLALATLWYRDRSARAYARVRDRIAAVNANFQESLSGVRVAQAYRREDRNIDGFNDLAGQYRGARLTAQRLVATYFPFVTFLSEVGAALVLGVGAGLARSGQIAPGLVIAFLLYIGQLFSPIGQLSQTFDQWQQANASMNKIRELMAIPPSLPVPAPGEAVVPAGRIRGEVELDHVGFRYAGATRPALEDLDLSIAPGQVLALVGPTGAGKSTVAKLVARLYDPTEGRVLVDGVPLDRYDPEAFHAQLGYVPQEPFLFGGTLADNIAYGRPGASREEVVAAARAVGADELAQKLPGGYDHVVAERGRSLSSGERQLVCLARALLVDPAILILDEATASLDLRSEARVNQAMGVLAHGRTTILVAHRLPTARTADLIAVMVGGRLAEIGTHEQLVESGGWYAEAWGSFELRAPAG